MNRRQTAALAALIMLMAAALPLAAQGASASNARDFQMNGTTLVKYSGRSATVVIPGGVTAIGVGAFRDNRNITAVTIPDGVTAIGFAAFSGCEKLAAVTIGNNVKSIGEEAFSSTALTAVTIPGGVVVRDAFRGCRSLAVVTIGGGVTGIENYAFNECVSLAAINVDSGNAAYSSADGVLYNKNRTALILYPLGKKGGFAIPGGVTSVGPDAFAYCSGLTAVTIPPGVTAIGDNAFNECTALTAVNIPSGVTVIADMAFYNCRSLASVNLSGNVTAIGNEAFSGCYALASITLPNSLTSIGRGAFCATGLTSVIIPDRVTRLEGIEYMVSTYGGVFENCQNLTGITIGRSVAYIGPAAFEGCQNLASVTFQGGMANFGFLDGNEGRGAFGYIGDLQDKYFAGGAGTYTTTATLIRGGRNLRGTVWTKQGAQPNPANQAAQTRQTESYTTTVSAAALYADHSANSKVIKTIKAGERVALKAVETLRQVDGMPLRSTVSVTFTDSSGKTWYQAAHGGSEGWILEEHLNLR